MMSWFAERPADPLGLFTADKVVEGGDNTQLPQGNQDAERKAIPSGLLYLEGFALIGCPVQVPHGCSLNSGGVHTIEGKFSDSLAPDERSLQLAEWPGVESQVVRW